ncbi:NAD-dependent epimerase/dehydratase family protein [Kutzneria albida]|uniref:NAD-dependent epimerase/dehydratase domain-containing protein n=1 Tax=Kutzneria albida DSM 43870 TaxID=1449976 RepID=W5WKC1_9PSEU|nr:NAD(P)-dependent oxidoreductase [Kutzneria albida]AHI01027.1 hypothetical protein KALB_7669 [Kutzneria albida DSM 43870]
MRIFLTGASGRVGSRTLPRLNAYGHQVHALVRDPAQADGVRAAGGHPVVGDLLDPDSYRAALEGSDAVVHLAAVVREPEAERVHRANHEATLLLGRAALDAGIGRFVFASTTLVYPGGLGRPATEDTPPDPQPEWGAYPVSKAAAERALLELHPGVRVLRLAFVYGEGDPHLAESLTWASHWPSHKRLHTVHHTDVAQAVLRALHAPGIDGRTYNVADESPVTAWELHALNGVPFPEGSPDPADPWHGISDTTRIRAELGFRPLYPSVWSAREAGAL